MKFISYLKVVCIFVIFVFSACLSCAEKSRKESCITKKSAISKANNVKIEKEKLANGKGDGVTNSKKHLKTQYDNLYKISASIRKIEKRLTELNKASLYYGVILESSDNAIKQKDAFIAKNIDNLRNEYNPLKKAFSSNKALVSNCCTRIDEINRSICLLQNKLKRNGINEKNLEASMNKQRLDLFSEYTKIAQNSKENPIKGKDKNDVINYVTKHAVSLTDLFERIRFEVSVGRFKDFNSCKIEKDDICIPVEFFLSESLDIHTPYRTSKFLVRKNANVFAPISGVVVFSQPYKTNGHVVILNNAKCGCVMLYGFGSSFVKLGDLVQVGQVIGETQESTSCLGFSEVFFVRK